MTLNEEWYNFFFDLHQLSIKQGKKIKQLEMKVAACEKKLFEFENEHSTDHQQMIHKIEYHFDQLKIEHLNGTLHIGLSPSDLKNIENFEDDLPMTQASDAGIIKNICEEE